MNQAAEIGESALTQASVDDVDRGIPIIGLPVKSINSWGRAAMIAARALAIRSFPADSASLVAEGEVGEIALIA